MNKLSYVSIEEAEALNSLNRLAKSKTLQDILKKDEFLVKLAGTQDNSCVFDRMADAIITLETESEEREQRIKRLEEQVRSMESDMFIIAKALKQCLEPTPLTDAFDMPDIKNFLNNKGIRV